MIIDAIILRELVALTNSINHKFLTPQESFDVEELNDDLVKRLKAHEKSQAKILEGFGAWKEGQLYKWHPKQADGISKALSKSDEVEIDIIRNMKILSKDSVSSQKTAIGLTTLQLRNMKEYLMIPEPEEDPKPEEKQ